MFNFDSSMEVKEKDQQKKIIRVFLQKNKTSKFNILIDGSNLYMRAMMVKSYEQSNFVGQDISILKRSVYSFLYVLKNIYSSIDKTQIDNIFISFDRGGSVRHRELLPTYKNKQVNIFAGLSPSDRDEEGRQFSILLNWLSTIPKVKIFHITYAEGDLVLSYLITKHLLKNRNVLVSGDRDFLQLLTYYPSLLFYYVNNKRNEFYDIFTFNDVLKFDEKLSTKEYLIFKVLVGDTSDNIPGIKGVGEKTAIEIIKNIREKSKSISEGQKIDATSVLIESIKEFKSQKETDEELKNILVRNFKLMSLTNFDLLSFEQKKEIDFIFEKQPIKYSVSESLQQMSHVLDKENIKLSVENFLFLQSILSPSKE